MTTTHVFHTYDINNIQFKKPEKITDKITIMDVHYNKKPFIIQTTKCLIPNVPVIYSYNNFKFYKLKVVAHNYNFEKKTKEFVNKVEKIDTYIQNKVKKIYKNKYKQKNFINTSNNYNNKVYFYFNIQFYNNKPILDIYDSNKIQKDLNYLIEYSHAYSLIWLKNIWIKNNKIGLNWVILQMKVYLPIYKIDTCLIIDDDDEKTQIDTSNKSMVLNNDDITYGNHPIYSKYFKMKRLRIPIPSIQQKMTLESIEPSIILKNENEIVTEKNVNNIVVKLGHLDGLKNIKLNKCKFNNDKKNNQKIDDNKMRPPTLEEILNIKQKLKKIM